MVSSALRLDPSGAFDAGDREPYGNALRDPGRTVYLRGSGDPLPANARLEIERFLADVDASDTVVLDAATAPVLDVGCGPGRFVHASIMAGHLTLGIDISEIAVQIAQENGLPVLRRSVFQDLPGEGTWGTVLLIDGNIGIGGDPTALMRRCGELIREPDGRVVVETHPELRRNRVFLAELVDDLDRESLPFPWAEVGARALRRHAARAGLTQTRAWTSRGRSFAEYARR